MMPGPCFTLTPRSTFCSILCSQVQTLQNASPQLPCPLPPSWICSWEQQRKIRRWEENKVWITGSPARSLPCCGPNRGTPPGGCPPHPSSSSSSQALVPPLPPSPHRPGVVTAPGCCLSLSAPLSSVGPHPTPICVTSPFTQPCGGGFCFLLGPWLLRYLNEE